MKRLKQRAISLMLTLCMILSMFPTMSLQVFAAEPEGGEEEIVYTEVTAATDSDLTTMLGNASANNIVKLTNSTEIARTTLLSVSGNKILDLNGKKLKITIADNANTNTGTNGMELQTNAKLTIKDSGTGGTLTVTNNDQNVRANQAGGLGVNAAINTAKGELIIDSGTVIATAGYYGAGIGGGSNQDYGKITINGGSVAASGGGYGGAGIGSGSSYYYSTGNQYIVSTGVINITGGVVTAKGNSYTSAGIGGGYYNTGGNITITGGYIDTTGNGDNDIGRASNFSATGTDTGFVKISGGSVKAANSKILPVPTNASGTPVYLVKATSSGIDSGSNVTVTYGKNPISTYEAPAIFKYYNWLSYYTENYSYLWLPAVATTMNAVAGGATKTGKYTVAANNSNVVTLSTLKIEPFDTLSEAMSDNEDPSPKTLKLTDYSTSAITASSTLTVNGDKTLDLAGLSLTIQTSTTGLNGIKILSGSKLTIIDSAPTGSNKLTVTNTASSDTANGNAAINVSEGELVINSGTISAQGGYYGAAIGGGSNQGCGTITINSGTVTATGGSYGAAIGGGYKGKTGTITINGGTVTATGASGSAAIGGGGDGKADITITSGTVTATGGSSAAAIGGGNGSAGSAGNILISGGRVNATGGSNAKDIGTGYSNAAVGSIKITGGSVWTKNKSFDTGYPKNEAGDQVYLLTLNAASIDSNTDIDITYGTNTTYKASAKHGDSANNSGNNTYVWLPVSRPAIESTKNSSKATGKIEVYATNVYNTATLPLAEQAFDELYDKFFASATDTITLDKDYTANQPLVVNGEKTLDLNGFSLGITIPNALIRNGIHLSSGSKLIITDSTFDVDDPSKSTNTLSVLNQNTSTGGTGYEGLNAAIMTTGAELVIEKGNVITKGGAYGAAIGGGYNTSNGTVTIKNGNVSAQSDSNTPAIGTYSSKPVGTINIEGGRVTALTTNNVAIGGNGSSTGIKITGGSIKTNGNFTSIAPIPVNEKGDKLYPLYANISEDIDENSYITASFTTTNGSSTYNAPARHADSGTESGKSYLWMPSVDGAEISVDVDGSPETGHILKIYPNFGNITDLPIDNEIENIYNALSAASAGTVTLTKDINSYACFDVVGNKTLDLNGHNFLITIPNSGGSSLENAARNAISLAAGANLTIKDSQFDYATSTNKLFADNSKDTNTAGKTNVASGINVPNGTSLIIESGIVDAKGCTYGSGIGGGNRQTCGTIDIKGGIVTAVGGYQTAAIGNGYNVVTSTGLVNNITISGGRVSASGTQGSTGNQANFCDIGSGALSSVSSGSGKVIITGGSVWTTARRFNQNNPVNAAGDKIYLLTANVLSGVDAGSDITASYGESGSAATYKAPARHGDSQNSGNNNYLWLPEGAVGLTAVVESSPSPVKSYTIKANNNNSTDIPVNASAVSLAEELDAASDDPVTIELDGDISIYDTLYVTGDKTIDLKGHNLNVIIADDLNDTTGRNGFKMRSDAKLTVKDSLYSQGKTNKLLVRNNDTKTSTTGENAGINVTDGSFVAESGIIDAQGGYYGAAIGGGYSGKGGNILLKGDIVTAVGGTSSSSAIGGGYNGSSGKIRITRGKVTATKGTSGQYDIGGYSMDTDGLIIDGGSVLLTSSSTSYPSYSTYPKNSNGDKLYLLTAISSDTVDANSPITVSEGILKADYVAPSRHGDAANSGNASYLWLPASTRVKVNCKVDTNDAYGYTTTTTTSSYTTTITLPLTLKAWDILVNDMKSEGVKDVILTENIPSTDANDMLLVNGTKTLDLNGYSLTIAITGNSPTGKNGIKISQDSTLKIKDSEFNASSANKLTITNSSSGNIEGSHGGINSSAGNLVIQSGSVDSTGGYGAAGIGGGYKEPAGNVVIEGGKVKSQGGYGAAGIGDGNNNTKATGHVTIINGDVNSTGGSYGAGIGSAQTGLPSDVKIMGGTVSANGSNSAGIGGANGVSGGTIHIGGGTITAIGSSNGAGIGGGNTAIGGDIVITGGSITATGGSSGAAGIGGGYNAKGGNISISNASVTASGGNYGAGIGGGQSKSSGVISITSGTIKATGGYFAPGIGNGYSASSVDGSSITIEGGSINAINGSAAPYGMGNAYSGTLTMPVSILGGSVELGTLDANSTPKNAAGDTLYLLTANTAGVAQDTNIIVNYTNSKSEEISYSAPSKHNDGTAQENKSCLWLPASNLTIKSTASDDSKVYYGNKAITRNDSVVLPLRDSAETSTETTTETTTQTTTQTTTASSTESSTQASTASSTESSTQASTASSTESSTQASTASSTESSTQASTASSTESSTQASTASSTESSTQASTASSTESSTQASTASSTESSTEASTASSTESSTQASTESSTDASTESSSEDDSESTSEGEYIGDVMPGDVDEDGLWSISDVMYIFMRILKDDAFEMTKKQIKSADANRDRKIDLSDVTYLMDLILSTPPEE